MHPTDLRSHINTDCFDKETPWRMMSDIEKKLWSAMYKYVAVIIIIIIKRHGSYVILLFLRYIEHSDKGNK